MATISPWRIALISVALVAATVALAAQFRASLARTPTTQAELDIVRGGKRPMDKHGMPRIYLKSEAYYETRSGMVNLYKACGKSVDSV